MTDATSAMERLRRETEAEHRHVEALPFFAALEAAELPLAAYVGFLRAMHAVHEALETEAGRTADASLAAVWHDELRRLPLLARDLAHFAGRPAPATTPAAVAAQLVAQRVRRRAHDDPASLLGYLYVLEGSTLGGTLVRRLAARAFDLEDGAGTAYLQGHGRQTKTRWMEFSRRVDAVRLDDAALTRAVEAAREAFAGIAAIVAALHPADVRPSRDPALLLNPEAGHHAIPDDPRELAAALRAGERTWREFPYYAVRYAERGERFTRSDSAWLVTLAQHEPAVAEAQVRWLGSVLASRGMPQWLLERHLEVLHEELAAALPERAADYAGLRQAARMLRELRCRHVDDAALARHAAGFDARAGADAAAAAWAARLPRTGALLAAAVADERAGLARAVPSLEGWMTDAARFPAAWVEAVRATLEEARVAP